MDNFSNHAVTFPAEFSDDDVKLCIELGRRVDEGHSFPTLTLTRTPDDALKWTLSSAPWWCVDLKETDIIDQIIKGSEWRKFGSVRSWVMLPVVVKSHLGVLFGLERIALAQPRSYPVAFYWLYEFRKENLIGVEFLNSLLRQLEKKADHSGDDGRRLENEVQCLQACRRELQESEGRSLVLMQTHPFAESKSDDVQSFLARVEESSRPQLCVVTAGHVVKYSSPIREKDGIEGKSGDVLMPAKDSLGGESTNSNENSGGYLDLAAKVVAGGIIAIAFGKKVLNEIRGKRNM